MISLERNQELHSPESCGVGSFAKYSHWAGETKEDIYLRMRGLHGVDTTPTLPERERV